MSAITGSLTDFRGIGAGVLGNVPSSVGGSSSFFTNVQSTNYSTLTEPLIIDGTAVIVGTLITIGINMRFKIRLDETHVLYVGDCYLNVQEGGVTSEGSLSVSASMADFGLSNVSGENEYAWFGWGFDAVGGVYPRGTFSFSAEGGFVFSSQKVADTVQADSTYNIQSQFVVVLDE